MEWNENSVPVKDEVEIGKAALLDDYDAENTDQSVDEESTNNQLSVESKSSKDSGIGSMLSEEADSCCHVCVYVCQTDICSLWEHYRGWETPAAVEGVMFLLLLANALFAYASIQYIFLRFAKFFLPVEYSRTAIDIDMTYTSKASLDKCPLYEDVVVNGTLEVLKHKIAYNTNNWRLLGILAYRLPSVFSALTMVSYTDVLGRKFSIIISTLGAFCGLVWCLVIDTKDLEVQYLVFACLVMGASGGMTSIMGCAYAYVSDTVSEESRTFRFSLLSVLKTVAYAIAGLVSEYLLQAIGYKGICLVLLTFHVVCLMYEVFILPESYKLAKKVTSFSVLEFFISMMLPICVYTQARDKPRARIILLLLLVILFIEGYVFTSQITITIEYLSKPPYCLYKTHVSSINSFSIAVSIAGPFISKFVLSKYLQDSSVAIVASLVSALGLAAQGLAYNLPTLYMSILLQLFMPITSAISNSIMTTMVNPEEQGALQASISSVKSLGAVLSVTVTYKVYSLTEPAYFGLIFIFLCLVKTVGMLLLFIVSRLQKAQEHNKILEGKGDYHTFPEVITDSLEGKSSSCDSLVNN